MRHLLTIGILGMAAASAAIPAAAAEHTIGRAQARTLQSVLDASAAGDVIRLTPGQYEGPLRLNVPVRLEGEPGAILLGPGKGSVVTVTAPAAVVRGLEIRGSGRDLAGMDSGVFVAASAKGALIENNRIIGNLTGVYLHGAAQAIARGNHIVGMNGDRMSEAGNGVTLWNAPGAQVIDNNISFGRDGIATNSSKRNVFKGNRFRNLRFAIHYMYTNDSEISDNVSSGNLVGYAIMFSSRLKIVNNMSDGDRDHGLLLNFANGSTVTGNTVRGRLQAADRWVMGGTRADDNDLPKIAEQAGRVDETGQRLGPEKCVFIYNANKNTFTDNVFEGCSIGIHFTAGSEGNAITGNAFIANRNQVKYVGTRYLDWSKNGQGNYWSDNPAFDLNGDGLGDSPYRPNDIIDQVLWTSPQAKVLTSSPAVQVIRWAQSQFPALLPGGVVDSRPLMAPPDRKDKTP
ncbi:nitrous oxide reductase family maturation protein NosD [Rhizobium sp. SEMIA 4085]|uniref:Nitrous oxidase maturation protein NosD n=1 Tax=Rhizobium gallicum bv. gallicum R602sp TaxID=1041138 RepID=A0A0B4XHR9_9HYPH|nr:MULTISPECIES: nitrous oxide reductase family maturation protein NosD [Rhizobium]AJD46153.1 nitrous oxidase maturation protein NosD [Rhizobium gallicum bv. gallicum R602sp]NNH30393.1 nitrous oxide reductase family maturation protein NosD [Rhizobium sp. SEMIA 4085]